MGRWLARLAVGRRRRRRLAHLTHLPRRRSRVSRRRRLGHLGDLGQFRREVAEGARRLVDVAEAAVRRDRAEIEQRVGGVTQALLRGTCVQ